MTIYQTYGLGCEKFRFKAVNKDKHLWQRVVKKFFIYWPVGPVMQEHPCNYYPEGHPECPGYK